jgi:hypothetical protein
MKISRDVAMRYGIHKLRDEQQEMDKSLYDKEIREMTHISSNRLIYVTHYPIFR